MKPILKFFTSLWRKTPSPESTPKDATLSKEPTWDIKAFTRSSLLWILVVSVVVSILLFLFVEPITKTQTVLVDGEEQTVTTVVFSWLKFWWYAVVIYTIASYRFWAPVKTGEQAALTLFEQPIANVLAGAPFAPLGFIQIMSITARTEQREFPAEPQFIDRSELKEGYVMPEHKRPPLRIQFRDSITEEDAKKLFKDDFTAVGLSGEKIPFVAEVPIDGLSGRVTAEVQHVVRLRVDDPCRFFSNVPGGSIDEAFRQIEDEMVSILTRYYTRMSVAQALMNIRWISVHLYNSAVRRVGARGHSESWGIDVQTAFVKLIHTSHGLNIAISEAAQAPFTKNKTIIDAEGERAKRELEGKGAALAARELERGTLIGRAQGLQKLALELKITGADAQAAEVARSIGDNGNTVVVGTEGFGQLAGIAAATLGNKTKTQKESSESSSKERSANQKPE